MSLTARRAVALGALWLVLFTISASYIFVELLEYFEPTRAVKLLRAYPSAPAFIWWFYLQWAYQPATLWRLVMSALPPVAISIGILIVFVIKPIQTGWPLRRSIPRAASEVPEAIRASTGRARTKTVPEMKEMWTGVDRRDGCGCVIGAAGLDKREGLPLFDPRDKSTWGIGGTFPLLISDRRRVPHLRIMAGSQQFKTTGYVVPTLITWGGPVVVFDPKEELYQMLRRHRGGLNHDVYALGPGANGFDALEWIDTGSISLDRDVASVVHQVWGEIETKDKRNAFFETRGMTFVRCAILDMMLDTQLPRGEKTLRRFRSTVAVGPEDLSLLLDRMAANSHPLVRQRAAPLRGDLQNAPEMFQGFQSSIEAHTDWLSDPGLSSLVSGNAFRASDLCNGATDVFLPLNFDILKTSPGLVRCAIGSLMNAVYKAKGKVAKRVLIEVDEADKVGRMDIFEKVRDTGASFGMNMDMAWQSTGQERDRYGLGGQQAWRASSTEIHAAVADYTVAKELSDRMGEKGFLSGSVSENTGTSRQWFGRQQTRSKSKNFSYNWQRQKQFTPEQILYEMPVTAQLVFTPGGGWPVVCERAIAFRREDINPLVDWP